MPRSPLRARIAALIFACASALPLCAPAATQQDQPSSAILLQGFHWNSPTYSNPNWYQILESKAADIKSLGFTHVWFPPPTDALDANGYLPRKLNVLDSAYGKESDLSHAIAALTQQGVQSVVDLVLNHRVGWTGPADFQDPAWDCRAVTSDDEWRGGCGNLDTGAPYKSARDLDHTQLFVRQDIETWLTTRIKPLGFTGIRFDLAYGFSPSYSAEYATTFAPEFCMGEIWLDGFYLSNTDPHRQTIMNYIDGTGGKCGAQDFTTKGILNEVLAQGDYWRLRDANGKPAGAIGWWPQKLVTFVETHDTGGAETCSNGLNQWPAPCDKVMQGYAYVLTHPGIPSVFYPHIYDWNLRAPIKALIDARRQAGILSTAKIDIQRAENGLYAAIVTGTTAQLAVKLGPNAWTPTGNWTLATSGDGYAVWISGGGGSGCAAGQTQVSASFTIANANTVFGENLYLVGNLAALGQWTATQAVPMTIQGSGANVAWTASISLPINTAVQYKYIKRNSSTGAVVWERNAATASGNREFSTACANVTRNDGNFAF